MEDMILTALLAVSLVAALVLVLLSSAALGRKLSDLEFQALSGINGVRTLQSWINVRCHANRVLLGMIFIFISALLLADAPTVLRTWSFRVLFVVLLLTFVASSLLDWLSERQQLQILMREQPPASVDVATIQQGALSDIVEAVADSLPPSPTAPPRAAPTEEN